MSSSITDPTSDVSNTSVVDSPTATSPNKGKGKAPTADEPMDEEEEEEEEDEEEEDEDDEGDEEDEDEDEEETYDEIDPNLIVTGGRRTRGKRVDYNTPEALEKAGLKPGDTDDEDDDVTMN